MKMTLAPKTSTGKWSIGLSVAFIIMLGLKMMSFMPIPSPVIFVMELIGFVIGIVAIIKFKERSILVFLSTFVGLLVAIWTAAEIIYPH
ncbi:MAG: hypothetical protein WCG21_14795 [Eubacteriales bacterium]